VTIIEPGFFTPEVVLADREERDPLHNDHLLVALLVDDPKGVPWIPVDPGEELLVHRSDPPRGLGQDLRVQVFAPDPFEDLPHPILDPPSIHRRPPSGEG